MKLQKLRHNKTTYCHQQERRRQDLQLARGRDGAGEDAQGLRPGGDQDAGGLRVHRAQRVHQPAGVSRRLTPRVVRRPDYD